MSRPTPLQQPRGSACDYARTLAADPVASSSGPNAQPRLLSSPTENLQNEARSSPSRQPGLALFEAVASNDLQHARKLLLQEGCTPNIRDADGNTPLHIAAEKGLTAMANVLIAGGADIEAQSGELSMTALMVAAGGASNLTFDVTLALFDLSANPRATGVDGITALDLAVRQNNIRHMMTLIKRGALIESRSSSTGWTPLHIAVGFNKPMAIAVLVKHGAHTNNRDADGDTPLITACSLGYIDCVQQLLEAGADPRIASSVCTY